MCNMKLHLKKQTIPKEPKDRSGAATVEFALVAPIFILLAVGTAEMGRALNVSSTMASAVREGGRLASMGTPVDLPPGTILNDKVIQDIRNMLTAARLPGETMDITITHADPPQAGQPFDLSDESNYLHHFRVRASVPYGEISNIKMTFDDSASLTSSVVFRLGRATISD